MGEALALKSAKARARRAVPLPASVKDVLRRWEPTLAAWTAYRRRQVEGEYRARREHYAAEAAERGLVYSEASTRTLVRERIRSRGYTPSLRREGEVHTFACFPSHSWHPRLLPDLRQLGPVTHFDFETVGFRASEFTHTNPLMAVRAAEMSVYMLSALRAAHHQRPVDWILFYGGGQDLPPDVLRRIEGELGIPTVNMSFDDKQGFAGAGKAAWRTGAVDITRHIDLFLTSARVACEWHLVEGGRPVYLPEGFDVTHSAPRDVPKDIPVSFVGVAYGFRPAIVRNLRRHGIDIRPCGAGWGEGHASDAVEIFNRSIINLGMGGIEYSEDLTNLKGRDFEIPGTGGGVYLTSFNPDLARHFIVGEEILCYRNRDEMIELIRHSLSHLEESAAMAARARARCLREHRWLHRYQTMLQILGILR